MEHLLIKILNINYCKAINATIEVTPKVFSPDNDGLDDIATIQYKINEPGYVANITIFDATGRPVSNLVRNGTLVCRVTGTGMGWMIKD